MRFVPLVLLVTTLSWITRGADGRQRHKTRAVVEEQLNEERVQRLIRDSYYEISAHVVSCFNEKCKLAVQNCLFQTQWERVFGKDKTTSTTSRTRRHHHPRSSATHGHSTSLSTTNSSFFNATYLVCQPFLVGRFCIDDYLKKSTEYGQCVNGTNGNEPERFRKSIYRDKCLPYYLYFFNHAASSTLLLRSSYQLFIISSSLFITFFISRSTVVFC